MIYKAYSPRASRKLFVAPTVGGATLKVKLDSVTQCFSMAASGWSRFGRTYTYADPGGSHGPVKAAQFKQTRTGGIQNRALIIGANGPVERWRALRDEIHAEVLARSWSEAKRSRRAEGEDLRGAKVGVVRAMACAGSVAQAVPWLSNGHWPI